VPYADEVSVVIPSYRHERYIAVALESVRLQTLSPVDVVVVDDGSTDRTAEVVAASPLPRLELLRQPNQGAHQALNRGVATARGTWIAILNSDDRFAPAHLEQALGLARASGAALIVGSVRLIDEDGHPLRTDHPTAVWYAAARADAERARNAREAFVHRNAAMTTSNFFMHRELWERLGGFRPWRYVHDWDFLLRAVELAPHRVVFEPGLANVEYRMHGANTITADEQEAAAELRRMQRSLRAPWTRITRRLGHAAARSGPRLDRALAAPAAVRPRTPPATTGEAPQVRLGIVVRSLDRGGLETVASELALHLPLHGISPFVLCLERGGREAERLARAGVTLAVADGDSRRWHRWLEDVRPDVLSTHFTPLGFVEAAAALGIPAVETVHNVYAWFGEEDWRRESAKFSLLAGVASVSSMAEQYLSAHVRHWPAHAAVIPNGVRAAAVCRIPRALARSRLGLDPQARVFVQHGRLSPQKNQVGLLPAFRDVLARAPGATLLLQGGGDDLDYRARLSAECAPLVATGQVRLLPEGPPELLLSAADAFVSNAFFEGWSLAAVEALSCGLPLVLSDTGGSRELVGGDGARGFVVPNPAGDPLAVDPGVLERPDAAATLRNRSALSQAMLAATEQDFWSPTRRDDATAIARGSFTAAGMAAGHARLLRAVVGVAA
jgi:glycosyltransferase involved in cell wall biosynthesis